MLDGDATSRCPLCAAALWADPKTTYGRMVCPRCEAELWFLNFGGETRFVAYDARHPITQLLAQQPNDLDSLEIVELLMELDEEQSAS